MSITKKQLEEAAVFKATNELQYLATTDESCNKETLIVKTTLQQKWANELGEENWRDIPLVISE